jgi:molybdate transport system ATP-binding protein
MKLSVTLTHNRPDLDVQFDAPAGITVLFGRSGTGKTTIINAVAGLLRPDGGRIVLGDRVLFDSAARVNVPAHRRRMGYIFQDARLLPHLNVRQNLTYGRWFARSTGGIGFDDVVDLLGISGLLTRAPATLSGGEKQRVAIGRALLSQPDLILADEPLASLDAARKAEILPYFERLRDDLNIPILYVSHSPSEVARLATTMIALERGRVSAIGPAQDILSDPRVLPLGVRAAGAVLNAIVKTHHADGLSELSAAGIPLFLPRIAASEGAKIRVRIAAQDVILSRDRPGGLSALNVLPGVVENIRAGDGPGAIVALKTPAGTVLARVTRRSVDAMGLRVGMTCHGVVKTVSIAPDDVGG